MATKKKPKTKSVRPKNKEKPSIPVTMPDGSRANFYSVIARLKKSPKRRKRA